MALAPRSTAELLVAAGLLPRNLRPEFEQNEVRLMLRRMVGVVERHELSPEIVQEMLAVLDG